MTEKYADCWSPSERKMKAIIEKLKGIFFTPLVLLLLKLKITANMVSYFSALLGLVSVIVLFFDIRMSAILLLISFMFDGIDGSLARASKKDNLEGSITDCFCDQIVISSTTIGFIAIGVINPIIGGSYLVTYPVVIIFTILRNLLDKPSIYVFRPRIIVYLIFIIYAFAGINLMDWIVLPLSIILFYQIIKDFYFLRGALKND